MREGGREGERGKVGRGRENEADREGGRGRRGKREGWSKRRSEGGKGGMEKEGERGRKRRDIERERDKCILGDNSYNRSNDKGYG